MEGAVEQIGDTELLAAGDRDATGLRQAAARRISCVHRGAGRDDQRRDVASLHRQRFDLRVRHDYSDGRITRLDQRRLAFDRQRFGELSQLKRDLDHRIAGYLQDDAALRVVAEAGERRFEAIGTDRQVQERE